MLPKPVQTTDFGLHMLSGNTPAVGQRGQARHAGRQVTKVATPQRFARFGKLQIQGSGLGVKSHGAPGFRRCAQQQMLDIGLNIFGPLRQPRQGVRPQIDTRKQVFAKAALGHVHAQVAVGASDQLKVAADLFVAAHGKEALFLHRLEQHGLLIEPQLANFIKKQHALMRCTQQACTVGPGARERAFFVTKQGRCRAVTAQGSAVDLNKLALHLVARFFELVNAPRQMRFTGTRGAGEQNRSARANRNMLNLFNQAVKAGVARGNAAFEELQRFGLRLVKTLGQHVITR